MSALKYTVPSLEVMRQTVQSTFNIRPCDFQLRSARAQLERRDVFTISPTGSGKTLTFWIPLLFNDNGITVIVTALNILGDQNVNELKGWGIPAVNVTADNISDKLFKASPTFDMVDGKYRVIIGNPELINNDQRFSNVWKSQKFTARLFNFTYDEGHCIKQWSGFRDDYAKFGRLRWILPRYPPIPFHVASATMPELYTKEITNSLQINRENLTIIRRSNDRPNIHLMVEEMKYSPKSFADLDKFLRLHTGIQPPKFMVFSNKRKECESCVEHLWMELPPHLRDKVVWFHSGMSRQFREETIRLLQRGEIWGIVCTDAAGMGLDIRDIELVIQWRYTHSLCSLIQRLGRAARGLGIEATGIYIVEPRYFDHNKKGAAPVAETGTVSSMKTKRKRETKGRAGPACKKAKKAPVATAPGPSSSRAGQRNSELLSSDNGEDSDTDTEIPEGGRACPSSRNLDPPTTKRPSQPILPEGAEHGLQVQLEIGKTRTYLPSPFTVTEDEYDNIAMDLFINSKTRQICRRVIPDEYCMNNTITNTEKEYCCPRCTSQMSRLCCDVCNPSAFLILFPAHLPAKNKRRKRRLKFDDYKMTTADFELKNGLDEWRKEQMIKEGLGDDTFFGPQIILSDETIQQIVDFAHHHTLPDTQSLHDHIDWSYASEYGEAIIALVKKHIPEPTPAAQADEHVQLTQTVQQAPQALQGDAANTLPARKKTQCSSCQSFGHIASNRLCPKYSERAPRKRRGQDTENAPPLG